MAIGEAVAAGLGAGASAAALFAGGLSARQAIRGRRQRIRLGYTIERLLRIDFAISRRSREIDHLLERGMEWAGVDVWPQGLTGQLNYLDGLTDELERTAASLRSIDDADSGLGRLRDDLEALCLALAEAAQRYHQGTLNSYRRTEGAPVGVTSRVVV